MTFVPLHHHSTYSMLDGHGFPSKAAEYASELGVPALAITDHGNMFGAFAHYKACNAVGIKPILGMEAYVADDMASRERMFWGELEEDGKAKAVPGYATHLTVLAKNAQGLRNLYRLHERSYLEGFYSKPRVDLQALRANSEGLIVLSGCVGGALSTLLRLGEAGEAYELARNYRYIFGDDYFIEIMSHGIPFEKELNPKLIELSLDLDIPLVATGDSHFVRPDDAMAHDAMLCVGTKALLSDEKRFRFSGSGYWVMGTDEMMRPGLLPKAAVHLSGEIAESVGSYDEVFQHQDLQLPGDPQELYDKTWDGFIRISRDFDFDDRVYYEDQIDHELDVIMKMGFTGYVLALEKIVSWARSQGIFIGNGRGSGAGSLTLYCLGVTNVDPIERGLVFERFLNFERKSVPDVDLDFESARRDEVMAYAVQEFGADFTCRILTLGTIATRRAVLDAAKVLGRSPSEAAEIKSLIPPDRRGRTLDLDDVPGLQDYDPEVFRLAKGLDGQLRQPGIHAGGLVISPKSLSDLMPVKKTPSDPMLVSGFTMNEVDSLGLVKIDLLSITTLDIIKQTLGSISGELEGTGR